MGYIEDNHDDEMTEDYLRRSKSKRDKSKVKAKNVQIHPCNCTDYNGGQCYNCLNGAHSMCQAKKKCKKRNSKFLGVRIVFKSSAKKSKKK